MAFISSTIAQDMARFEDKESKKSTTASMPSAKAGHGHGKRRSHRGSVHMLEPRQQHVVEEDIAELIKSGGLQLAVDVMLDAMTRIIPHPMQRMALNQSMLVVI